MTKTYFDIGGSPVPAEECMWVWIAPCGCECAWAVAADYCHSTDEAWENFARSKAVRRRNEKLGYRVEIKQQKDIRVSDNCPHTPMWGVEPRPQLAGHTWATTPKTRVLHLVPLVIGKDSSSPYSKMLVPSLCGRNDARIWSNYWCDVDGLVECTSCLKTAAERIGGAA